ncbi:MAG: hypothetical protein ACRDS9_23765 [Pseudonocardiaceae bacterium]
MTPDRDPATQEPTATQGPAAPRVPGSELPTKIPAGRRSSVPEAPGGQPDPSPVITRPVISSSAAAAQVLCDHFLTNADRGDHAANDELIAELLRRIRARQAAIAASE